MTESILQPVHYALLDELIHLANLLDDILTHLQQMYQQMR